MLRVFFLILALGIVYAPGFSRIVRGPVLGARHLEYVEASRVMGASDARILFRDGFLHRAHHGLQFRDVAVLCRCERSGSEQHESDEGWQTSGCIHGVGRRMSAAQGVVLQTVVSVGEAVPRAV